MAVQANVGSGPIGIVGCGAVTRATIGALMDAGGRVAWVADPDPTARAALCGELIARARPVPQEFDGIDEGLKAGPFVTSVIVNSPAALHLDHVERCARNGRAVLIAKPLATSYADAVRALDIAASRDVGVFVAEQYPYVPHAVEVQRLIATHGPPQRISFDHRKPASGQSTLGGVGQTGIIEFGVHHYAVLTSWLKELPEAISVDTWGAGPRSNGRGSLGHGWLRYTQCHVDHVFGFGSPHSLYRLEVDMGGSAVQATGSHFSAGDVELSVLGKDRIAVKEPPSAHPDPWVALFTEWLATSITETSECRRWRALAVTAMMDAAVRSAVDGVVAELDVGRRYPELA